MDLPPEYVIHRRDSLILHVGNDVTLNVERDRGIRVPKQFSDNLHMYPSLKKQGCAGVS